MHIWLKIIKMLFLSKIDIFSLIKSKFDVNLFRKLFILFLYEQRFLMSFEPET